MVTNQPMVFQLVLRRCNTGLIFIKSFRKRTIVAWVTRTNLFNELFVQAFLETISIRKQSFHYDGHTRRFFRCLINRSMCTIADLCSVQYDVALWVQIDCPLLNTFIKQFFVCINGCLVLGHGGQNDVKKPARNSGSYKLGRLSCDWPMKHHARIRNRIGSEQ